MPRKLLVFEAPPTYVAMKEFEKHVAYVSPTNVRDEFPSSFSPPLPVSAATCRWHAAEPSHAARKTMYLSLCFLPSGAQRTTCRAQSHRRTTPTHMHPRQGIYPSAHASAPKRDLSAHVLGVSRAVRAVSSATRTRECCTCRGRGRLHLPQDIGPRACVQRILHPGRPKRNLLRRPRHAEEHLQGRRQGRQQNQTEVRDMNCQPQALAKPRLTHVMG